MAESYEKIVLVVSFLIPTFCLLLPFDWLLKEMHRLRPYLLSMSFSLIFINFIALVYEMINGPLIGAYSRSDFRATGIFVNPNNSSIFLVFLFYFVFYLSKNRPFRFFVLFLTFFCLVLMGSKTGLLMFVLLLFFLVFNSPLKILLLSFALLFISTFLGLTGLDEFDFYSGYRSPLNFESAFIRLKDWADLGHDLYNGSVLEFLFGGGGVYLVDNAYMDILSNFGIFMLFVFLFLQIIFIFISFRLGRFLILFNLIFLAAMITTNVHRLWPVSYVYWALMGWSFYYFNIRIAKFNKGEVSV